MYNFTLYVGGTDTVVGQDSITEADLDWDGNPMTKPGAIGDAIAAKSAQLWDLNSGQQYSADIVGEGDDDGWNQHHSFDAAV